MTWMIPRESRDRDNLIGGGGGGGGWDDTRESWDNQMGWVTPSWDDTRESWDNQMGWVTPFWEEVLRIQGNPARHGQDEDGIVPCEQGKGRMKMG